MKILSIEDVSLAFGGLNVLSDISFDVNEGEIFAIIGPNGAGKTSVLNIISGFYRPNNGKVFFQGNDLTGLHPDKRCLRNGQNLPEYRLVPWYVSAG